MQGKSEESSRDYSHGSRRYPYNSPYRGCFTAEPTAGRWTARLLTGQIDSPVEGRGSNCRSLSRNESGLSGGKGSAAEAKRAVSIVVYPAGDRGFESLYPSKRSFVRTGDIGNETYLRHG